MSAFSLDLNADKDCARLGTERSAALPPRQSPASQFQQGAERSCWRGIIKTSVKVTGSGEGTRHSGAPLLSCFLCELSRPACIYSSEARLSPSSQTDVTFKPPRISGVKYNAFSSLTRHTREPEDDLALTLADRQGAANQPASQPARGGRSLNPPPPPHPHPLSHRGAGKRSFQLPSPSFILKPFSLSGPRVTPCMAVASLRRPPAV